MANGKISFIGYCNWLEIFEELSNEEAGELIKHTLRYVNDQNPTPPSKLVGLLFIPIKQTLKRDLKKYERTLDKQAYGSRLGNLKRWHPELYKKVVSKELSLGDAEGIAYDPKSSPPDPKGSPTEDFIPDSEYDSDSDSEYDSDSVLLKKETKEDSLLKKTKEKKIFNFKKSLIEVGFEKKLVDDWLAVRKTKKATNTETAFKRTIPRILAVRADKNEVLRLMIEKSWASYKTHWYYKENNIPYAKDQNGIDVPLAEIQNEPDLFR